MQDLLLLGAVCLLGYAVAIHQAFVERLTTLQDFPISSLAIAALSSVYVVVAWQAGASAAAVGALTILAVLTHSIYDVVRGFLDRLFHRRQAVLRQELHTVARSVGGLDTLQNSLQRGLVACCQLLSSPGGFIAVRDDGGYRVAASLRSLTLDSRFDASVIEGDEVSAPASPLANAVAWLAPAFVGQDRAAILGLSARTNGSAYSEADLDILSEAADWVGLTLALATQQQARQEDLSQMAQEVKSQEIKLQAAPEELSAALESDLNLEFVRAIEYGLRHMADYTALGQSPLGDHLHIQGKTGLERGRVIRQRLVQAIEMLRPEGQRPPDPLPRAWHSYAVLHDAYVEDVSNREIMARLYISEGTFNRQRRKALRGVARHLLELSEQPLPALAATASTA